MCEESYEKRLCRLIRERRKSLGLSQEFVAKNIMVSRTTYGAYEQGNISINIDSFMRICKVLNIEVCISIWGEPEEKKQF